MSNESAGGLFIQVKLQTDAAEAQLRRLTEAAGRASAGIQPGAGAAAVTRQVQQVSAAYEGVARASQKAGQSVQQTVAAEVKAAQQSVAAQNRKISVTEAQNRLLGAQQVLQQKVAAVAATPAGTSARSDALKAEKAAIAAVADAYRQLSAAKARAAEVKAGQDDTKRLKREQEALREQIRLQKEAAAAQKALRSLPTPGAQELFVGLGAARSGNYFYGIAAGVRYFKNLAATARSASGAISAGTVAFGAIAIAAAVAALAIGGLVYAVKQLGQALVQQVANYEILRIQITGLLGDTRRAQEDLNFILRLGTESIVPTQSLLEANRSLITFGVTSDKVRRNLVAFISDFGTAAALTEQQIYFLTLALGQIVAKGKADAIDLRQLANVGISQTGLLRSIADITGNEALASQKAVSEGLITSELVMRGLLNMGARFQTTADAAKQSFSGLTQNIKESLKTLFTVAGDAGGVLEPLKGFLIFVDNFLKQNTGLFVPLAQSFNLLFSAITGASTGDAQKQVAELGRAFAYFVQVILPAFIRGMAYVANIIRQVFLIAWNVVKVAVGAIGGAVIDLIRTLGPLFPFLKVQLAAAFLAPLAAIAALSAGLSLSAGMISFFISMVVALVKALSGDFAGAAASAKQGMVSLVAGGLRAKAVYEAIFDAAKAIQGVNATLPEPTQKKPTKAQTSPDTGLPPGLSEEDTAAAEKAAAAAKKAAQKLAQARNDLFELIAEYFGQPSEALTALYGDAGKFDATVDSIVGTAKRMSTAVETLGRFDVLALIDRQTRKLIGLAESREKVTRQLEDAQKRLEDVIAARDSLVSDLKRSAFNYLNALSSASDSVGTYRRLDDVGSFIQTEKEQTANFVETLRERIAAYRLFVSNIAKLQSRGLDADLVRSFVEAGPEAAGAAVSELVAANDETLDEVNGIQDEMRRMAGKFAKEQGDVYYSAGIAQAQAVVDGFEAKLASLDKAARKAADTIIAAIRPLAKRMKDIGEDAAAGLGAALGGAGGSVDTSWIDDLPDFDTSQFDLSKLFSFDELDVTKKAEEMVNDFFSGVEKGLANGPSFNWIGAILKGLPGPLDLVGALAGLIITGLTKAFPNLWPAVYGAFKKVWGNITGSMPSASSIAKSLNSIPRAVADWVTKTGIPTIKAWAGALWGSLFSGEIGFSSAWNFFSPILQAFKAILRALAVAWNKFDLVVDVPKWIGLLVPALIPVAGKKADLLPDIPIPKLASGGVVSAPTLALIGEAGPEAVVPLNRAGLSDAFGGVAGGDTYVTVELSQRTIEGIAQVTVERNGRKQAVAAGAGVR